MSICNRRKPFLKHSEIGLMGSSRRNSDVPSLIPEGLAFQRAKLVGQGRTSTTQAGSVSLSKRFSFDYLLHPLLHQVDLPDQFLHRWTLGIFEALSLDAHFGYGTWTRTFWTSGCTQRTRIASLGNPWDGATDLPSWSLPHIGMCIQSQTHWLSYLSTYWAWI